MEWKSNCRWNQKPEEGSIFELKDNPLRITIHHYAGCGNEWFLSCPKLGIKQHSLNTEDFNEAVRKAKLTIELEARRIFLDAQAFFKSTEENIMVKY